MDSREFRRRFRGSPLERTGRKRLLRNIAIAVGNSGDARFLPQLEQLAKPSEAADSAGATADAHSTEAVTHPNDQALREAAEWARTQILTRSAG
jgi:hypothetical protein